EGRGALGGGRRFGLPLDGRGFPGPGEPRDGSRGGGPAGHARARKAGAPSGPGPEQGQARLPGTGTGPGTAAHRGERGQRRLLEREPHARSVLGRYRQPPLPLLPADAARPESGRRRRSALPPGPLADSGSVGPPDRPGRKLGDNRDPGHHPGRRLGGPYRDTAPV
ncbi:MAG: hypothetical protein AVDCRST_MAG01-01-5295, partial [uncultured Rubrobacteraceae bacterium]